MAETPSLFVFDVIKAVTDRLLATLLVVALSPILVLVALTLVVQQPRLPVLFVDRREGKDGRPFAMLKFRTVTRSPDGQAVSTRFQALCRCLGLDELPQLVNIAAGQMSFVGPRPFNYADLANLSAEARATRTSVRPGLVGLWQLGRRDKKDWANAERLDACYVANRGALLDVSILALSPLTILGDALLLRRTEGRCMERLAGDQLQRDPSSLFNTVVQLAPADSVNVPLAERVAN